jgi:hypothetical protein
MDVQDTNRELIELFEEIADYRDSFDQRELVDMAAWLVRRAKQLEALAKSYKTLAADGLGDGESNSGDVFAIRVTLCDETIFDRAGLTAKYPREVAEFTHKSYGTGRRIIFGAL